MMMTRLTTSELETWAMVSWSIWNARNKFHFEQVQTPPCVIFKGASSPGRVQETYWGIFQPMSSVMGLIPFLYFFVSLFSFFQNSFFFFGFSLRLIATELVLLIVQPSGAKSLYSFFRVDILLSFYCQKKKEENLDSLKHSIS